MYTTQLRSSSYPNCIKYHELDVAKGCSVKCIYCGLANADKGVQRINVDMEELAKQIHALKNEGVFEGIYLNPNTDAFAKICADATHEILETFLPQGVKFLLITKSIIPPKTIQLLAKYRDQITIKISLSRTDQELIKYTEPGAASATDRLTTMKSLIDAGIEKTQVLLMPLYPGIDDQEGKIIDLIDKIKETGVKLVKAAFVVIRNGEKAKDIEMINKMLEHPKLKQSWALMTETQQKVQIGEGKIYPSNERFAFYKMVYKICNDRNMKFSACCVLDPALFQLFNQPEYNTTRNNFQICKNLKFLPDQIKKMKSEFKHPHELSQDELEQVYAIHKKVYVSKGIGLDFDIWQNHLLKKRYHNVADKMIQLFYFNDLSRIDAYNILTEPIQIEGEFWSKLIECGASPVSSRDIRSAFLTMYKDLLFWRDNIIFFGETSIQYHTIINLLKESKFTVFYDVSKLKNVFKTFIQSNEFELYNGEQGVEIKRKTFYTPTYHGYVVVNDFKQNLGEELWHK